MNENNENKAHAASEADVEEFTEKPFNLGKEVFEWFYTIVIALAIAFTIKGFLFDIVNVDGSSMYPTLHDKDMLIVRKIGYTPAQGDIIILDSNYKNREEYYTDLERTTGKSYSAVGKFFNNFTLDKNRLQSRYYVKRIVALPGQTVDMIDGDLYVDGQILDEPYYDGETNAKDPAVSFPLKVEENHVFVLGDNREHSTDSRFSSLGQVPYDAVMGKASFRILPITDFGTL